MIKKSIALCMLSLALSCQSSLAVSVENQSQTSSITIKSNIKSEDSLKSEFVEVIPGAFKRVGTGNSKTPRKLSAEEIELLKAQSQKRAKQRLIELQKSDMKVEYQIFDLLYNDRDEKALKQITRYNTLETNKQGYGYGSRDKPLRIVSPYMRKNGHGEIKLTNPVNILSYRTRADKNKAIDKEVKAFLEKNKGKSYDLYTARTKEEIKESIEAFFKPIELIEYPVNNPKDYKLVATISGFPKQIPSFAKNIHLHSNPPFLQGGSYVQLAFGGTLDQLKPYIDEARINSKVVISKSDLSNVYVKNYVDSDMEYADTLKTLMPTSIVIVENTTVPMGKYVQNQVDNPIEKSVDEMYALQNQVLAEFNKIKIDGEDSEAKYKRYVETRKRVEAERDILKPKQMDTVGLDKKEYPIYTELENRKLQKQYLHRLSFNEDSVEIPDDYVIYLFDFGGNWNHPYALGAAVSPEKNYIIYFCQRG
ncbi:hypothetical protein DWZ94_02970 [Veillonella atypica]|uniref:hypothetical protein n=1 Tax=Veillonella atypica TaxID=39777 RepID=UPI000E4DB841|nr:hypothetical protein [Veillonella atypica]RHL92390.1 hypothetical protein DWZ94_02970 [Veillonella atypica]